MYCLPNAGGGDNWRTDGAHGWHTNIAGGVVMKLHSKWIASRHN